MNTRQAKANNINRIALGVLIVIISLFCFLCVVGALGGVGRMVYSFLIGFFGLADYAYCVTGIVLGLAVIFNVKVKMRPSGILKLALLFALGILALQIYSSSAHFVGANYASYLTLCYNFTNTAGGMLFGIIAYPLMMINTVAALILVCIAFFTLATFAMLPFYKKNVTYTSSTKAQRDKFRFKHGGAANGGGLSGLGRLSAPTITDLSASPADGQNLFVLDVEGDSMQKTNKKQKGADGYNPLYPNAKGNIEDEETVNNVTHTSDKFSPKGFARDILFSENPQADSYQRFNTTSNPDAALRNVDAPYSAIKRNELKNKLGIDTSDAAVKESFRTKYKLGADVSKADGNKKADNASAKADNLSVNDGGFERDFDAKNSLNNGKNSLNNGKNSLNNGKKTDENAPQNGVKEDFYSLKQDQIRVFSDMYDDRFKPEFETTAYGESLDGSDTVKAETVKKELVKPTRIMKKPEYMLGESINETIDKAQSAVLPTGNLAGIHGAVARAISGGEQNQPKSKAEIQAEGYDSPAEVFDRPAEVFNRPADVFGRQNGAQNQADGTYNAQNDGINRQNNAQNQANGTYNAQNDGINRQNGAQTQPNGTYNAQNIAYNALNDAINRPNVSVPPTEKPQIKIPRAFEDTAIYTKNDNQNGVQNNFKNNAQNGTLGNVRNDAQNNAPNGVQSNPQIDTQNNAQNSAENVVKYNDPFRDMPPFAKKPLPTNSTNQSQNAQTQQNRQNQNQYIKQQVQNANTQSQNTYNQPQQAQNTFAQPQDQQKSDVQNIVENGAKYNDAFRDMAPFARKPLPTYNTNQNQNAQPQQNQNQYAQQQSQQQNTDTQSQQNQPQNGQQFGQSQNSQPQNGQQLGQSQNQQQNGQAPGGWQFAKQPQNVSIHSSGEMTDAASMRDMASIPKNLPKAGQTFEQAEMEAKINDIKNARKDTPPLSPFEQNERLREEKMRAARDRGMQKPDLAAQKYDNSPRFSTGERGAQKPDIMVKKSEDSPRFTDRGSQKTDAMAKRLEENGKSQERMTQINIEQAISQATPKSPYVAPPIRLLKPADPPVPQDEDYEWKKKVIVETLASFSINSEVIDILVGPTFSLYTLKVEMTKGRTIGSIINLEKDLAMKMEASNIRILAPIPGKNAVGIEVPNKRRRIVRLQEILTSPAFNQSKSPATFALGKNLYGTDFVCDIKDMPHLLIAGATGAGKSCAINSIIISFLYKASPEDVRLILIDPKRVELSIYAGIPHLLLDEIVCDVDKAIRALNWSITEMNRRIQYLSDLKYRDIDEYNADCAKMGYEKMPRIVIIVDELADLMSMGKKAVEDSINRIARLARAVGIHLVLATQRPSVDVISGTIKNNLPSRVAFMLTSGPDSRTVLDENGAEKLLGNGDLLYMTPRNALLERMQGAFISNSEVKDVVDFIKQNNESYFDNSIKDAIFKDKPDENDVSRDKNLKKQSGLPPEIFDALGMGIELDGAPITISNMQRKLGLGWPKAAKIYDMMDDMGYLSPDEKDSKKKFVNINKAELDELIESNFEDDKDE